MCAKSLTLAQAAKHIGQTTGRQPSIPTIWRWATRGTKGRKLVTYLHGGIRMTTPDAIDLFFAHDPIASGPSPTIQQQPNIGHAAATAACDAAGI